MRKQSCLFLAIILGGTMIALCQNTNLDARILKDSATYSWDQINEVVNGLENEKRLDSVYRTLLAENLSLSMGYNSIEKRLINYRDTIVPAYQNIIKTKDANFIQLTGLNESTETELKKQKVRKWFLVPLAVILGYLVGSL